MAKHRFERKRRPFAVYLWVLILILIGSAVWGVSAKYAQQREEELLVQAKMFYFTSDLLKEGGASYTLNPDTTEVRFTLNSFADSLRVSEDPIQYTYTIDGKESSVAQLDNGENKTDTITFDVEAGKTYEVSATGIAGYAKTLSATFTVAKAPTGFYKHLDTSGDYYVLLTVWTENVSGDVAVSFPAGLIPDATDSELDKTKNYSDGHYATATTEAVAFGAYSSRTYRFFKEDPSIAYSLSQFEVKMGETKAVPGTP